MIKERLDLVLNIISGSPNRLRESVFKREDINLYNSIIDYTSDIDILFKQRVWHWINEISSDVKCIECDNKVSFNMNWKDGYKKFCSNKCSSNNKILRENTKKTLVEKYGVDHYSKTDEYVVKVKSTSLKKYGVDNYSKTPEYVKKSKNTYMKRYGVDSYTKTDLYIEKTKKTCLDKYGVDSYVKTDEYKDRFRKTCLDKYGEDHIYKTILYRSEFNISKNVNYVSYKDGLNTFKCDVGHLFEINTDNYYGRTRNNIPLCTICNPIGDLTSIKEVELFNYIKYLYTGEIIQSYRDGLEIDIYLPELKIGFEFNGLYWHSEKFKDKSYHLYKTDYFKDRDIRIIHVWEDDWSFKMDIIKSQIRNLLKLNVDRIWGRNCKVVELNNVTNFLNINHVQGVDRSSKKIGLTYNGLLVSVMTFNKLEGRDKMIEGEWNLSRFCNLLDTNVIGGASKLLKYFTREYKPTRIISYADKDWSIGSLYYTLGFKNIKEGSPDYKYVINNKRKNKQNFTKSKLKINNLTESKYMSNNNLYKIWDCGKIKFEIIIN